MLNRRQLLCAAALAGVSLPWTEAQADDSKPLPTVYLVGDSTVKVGTPGQQGWGEHLGLFLDTSKIRLENRARGGRSSRTFRTEGLWDAIVAQLKPGDYVLIQLGHNDSGPLDDNRARGSLRGVGEETREVTLAATGKTEVVHTYGWYLREYVREARAKSAIPIVLSPIPRNSWATDGKTVNRAKGSYGGWAQEVARAESALFVDLNEIVARRYEVLGKEAVATFFGATDHTHTNPDGAKENARCVVSGLKALPGAPFAGFLSPQGQKIAAFAAIVQAP